MSNSYWDDIDVKVDDACPIATSDIAVNLKNRQKAIDTAGYGPLNPTKPNNEFWDAKAERWNVTADDARGQKCGNCAAFIQTKRMLDCIDKGLGNESGNAAWDVIDAGDLGYCEAFDFKCASSRTCDTWIVGGPITEEKENNMEEKSLEDMYSELLAIEEKSFEEKSLEDAYLELLAIEEKVAPIVPVRPDTGRLRPRPEKRFGKPYRPGRGAGLRNMPWYKAEEEDEPEDDMLYDEDYMGDEEDDKGINAPLTDEQNRSLRIAGDHFSGRSGDPRATADQQATRGRSRVLGFGNAVMNTAGSRIPGPLGDNRNRPAPKPNIQPAPLPTQNYSPRKKPKDWGSDNNAQLISGGIPQKSAWDEEAYYEYEYDFDMKKLPVEDPSPSRRPVRGPGNPGAPKPTTRSSGPSPDARPSPAKNPGSPTASAQRGQFKKFGDHLEARDIGESKGRSAAAGRRQAGLKKYVGDVAIGAAGASSGSPVGDNRGRTRPVRGPGNPGAPKPRPTRGSGNPGPKVNQQRGLAAAGDYFSGRSGDPRATADQQATRGRERISKFGRDVIGDGSSLPGADRKGPQPKPGKMNRVTPSKRREDPPRQRPLAFNQAVPRQNKPSQGGLERAMRRQNKPSQSLLGENFSKSYDQGYDEYDEYENYLYQKSYDEGYEYDEYDYIDSKAAGSPGDAAARQQSQEFRKFGDHLEARDIADGPQRAAESAKRKAGLGRYASAVGAAGLSSNKTPHTPMSPGGLNRAPRPGMRNTPNRTRPGNVSPGAGGPRGPRPGANKPSSGGGGLFFGESLGSRWDRWTGNKGSDSEMYWDDDDEMAIPPDTNDKAEYTDTQRAEFRKFGDHLEARDIGDVDKRAAISAKRKAGLGKVVAGYSSAMGTAQTYGGNRSTSKPRPVPGPGRRGDSIAPRVPVGGGRGLSPGNPGPKKTPNPRRYV